jgi:hypothetical protein
VSNKEPFLKSVNSLLIICTLIFKSLKFSLSVLIERIMISRPRIASSTRCLVVASLTFGKRIPDFISSIIDRRSAILADGALPYKR